MCDHQYVFSNAILDYTCLLVIIFYGYQDSGCLVKRINAAVVRTTTTMTTTMMTTVMVMMMITTTMTMVMMMKTMTMMTMMMTMIILINIYFQSNKVCNIFILK